MGVRLRTTGQTKVSMQAAIRFSTDPADHLPRFDPIFRRPIFDGWNALPIGNGDLAAVFWQPDHLTWMLNKNDVDLAISQMARVTIETPTPLAQRLGRFEGRLSLLEASATLRYRGGELPSDAAGIWPDRAEGDTVIADRPVRARHSRFPSPGEADLGSVEVSSFISSGHNALLIDCRERTSVAQPVTIVLERWLQPEWGEGLEVAVADDALTLTYVTAAGITFSVALVTADAHGAKPRVESPVRLSLAFPPATDVGLRIAVAVVTSRETGDPRSASLALARRTLQSTTIRQAHEDAWRAFWDASFVDAGHPYLNALYHVALYQLGICSRGRFPVKFNGALNLWHELPRDWGPNFWCHNESSVFLPVYAANHIELADALHTWIVEMLPRAQEAARTFHGASGAFYHEVMTPTYAIRAEDGPAEWEIGLILSSGVRYALLLWDRYRYSLDEAFLRERAYPVIRACAEFYQACARRGEDDRCHIGPALSWEARPAGTDTHADCAAWRAIFTTVIAAADVLGNETAETLAVWRDLLARAPAYPSDGRIFSIVIRDDGRPEPADHWQWQMPQLSGVFPYSVMGVDSPQEVRRMAEQTFLRYRFTADAGHEYFPVIAARLGNAEWWRAAMFAYIQFFQTFDQGLFHYYNIHGNRNKDRRAWTTLIPYLEGSGILATATQEMLLQSHDGVIRVFPAMPDFWEGRFLLRAAGSFLVASEHRRHEGVPYIAIQPVGGRSRQCRVAIPWATAADLYVDGQPSPRVVRKGRADFQVEPGSVYVLLPAGRTLDRVPLARQPSGEPFSPCRLGQANYGQPDGAFQHDLSFPLW